MSVKTHVARGVPVSSFGKNCRKRKTQVESAFFNSDRSPPCRMLEISDELWS